MIKELRERTGAGVMDCKAALNESDGDMEKSVELLRKKRADIADKKSGREAKNGMIGHYAHIAVDGGAPTLGVLAEVLCETDFAARSPLFKKFVNEICLHIAVAAPRWVKREEVPQDILDKEKEIMKAQLLESGKPEAILDKIVEGKITKFFQENCLLEQEYALAADKSAQVSIEAKLKDISGQLGERVAIRRFARIALGGD